MNNARSPLREISTREQVQRHWQLSFNDQGARYSIRNNVSNKRFGRDDLQVLRFKCQRHRFRAF